MSIQTYDDHIAQLGAAIKDVLAAANNLQAVLAESQWQDMGSLTADKYAGRAVTKAQYDAAVTSAASLKTWLASGEGTNFSRYLTERP